MSVIPNMTEYELINVDPEDIEELLLKVETSFNIQFSGEELTHIKTFGQLCDHISDKILLRNLDDCTSQQAFYKLRNAIVSVLPIKREMVTSDLLLNPLLPRKNRRSQIKKLEKCLGFKLNILRPAHWVTGFFGILLIVSIIGVFLFWSVGVLGVLLGVGGLWVSNQFGNEMDKMTIGQLAKKVTRENYAASRRHPGTFNKAEIEKILTNWFSDAFDLDKSKLTREARLF